MQIKLHIWSCLSVCPKLFVQIFKQGSLKRLFDSVILFGKSLAGKGGRGHIWQQISYLFISCFRAFFLQILNLFFKANILDYQNYITVNSLGCGLGKKCFIRLFYVSEHFLQILTLFFKANILDYQNYISVSSLGCGLGRQGGS